MKNKIALLSCFLFSSCAFSNNASFNIDESFSLNGQSIKLDSKNCEISYQGEVKSLGVNGTCLFAKESNTSKIKTYFFDDIQSEVAVIIGNSIIDNPDYPVTQKRNDCGDSVVGITVSNTGDLKLKASEGSSVYCAGIGAGETLYWVLSHD